MNETLIRKLADYVMLNACATQDCSLLDTRALPHPSVRDFCHHLTQLAEARVFPMAYAANLLYDVMRQTPESLPLLGRTTMMPCPPLGMKNTPMQADTTDIRALP